MKLNGVETLISKSNMAARDVDSSENCTNTWFLKSLRLNWSVRKCLWWMALKKRKKERKKEREMRELSEGKDQFPEASHQLSSDWIAPSLSLCPFPSTSLAQSWVDHGCHFIHKQSYFETCFHSEKLALNAHAHAHTHAHTHTHTHTHAHTHTHTHTHSSWVPEEIQLNAAASK